MTSLYEKKLQVVRESAERALEDKARIIEVVCESPIEELFLTALISRGCWRERLEFVHSHPMLTLLRLCEGTGMTMAAQQVQIGEYRVDFLLVHERYHGEAPILLAIECDGHDFHEKTKQQAARDKARDRALVSAGVTVMRFTGAEIWADAGACVDEALGFIDAEWSESASRLSDRIEREKDRAAE